MSTIEPGRETPTLCFEDLLLSTALDQQQTVGTGPQCAGMSMLAAELFGFLDKPVSNLLARQFDRTEEVLRNNASLLLYTVVRRYRQFLVNTLGSAPQDAVYIRGATQRRERYAGERGAQLAAQLDHLSKAISFSGVTRGRDDWVRKAFSRLNSQSDLDLAFFCPETNQEGLERFWEAVRMSFGITNLKHIRVGEQTVDDIFQGTSQDGRMFFEWRERKHSGNILHAYLYMFVRGDSGSQPLTFDIALASPLTGDTRFGPFAQIRDRAGKLNLLPLDDGRLMYREDTASPYASPEHDVAAAFAEWPYFEHDRVPDAISSALRGAIDLNLWPPQQSVVNCDNGYGMGSYQFENMQIGLMPTNYPLECINTIDRRRDEILHDIIRLMLIQDPEIFISMIMDSNLYRIFPNLCDFIGYPYDLEALAVRVYEYQPNRGLEGLDRARSKVNPERLKELAGYIWALQQYSKQETVAEPLSTFTAHLTTEDRELAELLDSSERSLRWSPTYAAEFAILQFLARMFLPGGEVVDTIIVKKQ